MTGHFEPTIGASDEWYTPPEVFAALGVTFDLDVSPARYGTSHVPAARGCFVDGLEEPWTGFVWCNPPFGGRNGVVPWLRRFAAHGNGVLLTPDRTGAAWFHDFWKSGPEYVLFTRKLKFLRPDGTAGAQPSNGTALWSIGDQGAQALANAAAKGFGVLSIIYSR